MSKTIIGVMGPGDQATPNDKENAYALGRLIAQQGWILLTGGRNVGVMDAACQGAKHANGLTVGILPGSDSLGMSSGVDIPILTGIGSARNYINVLTSHLIIACGMGAGTASEVALALKANKPVILLHADSASRAFFQTLSSDIVMVETPEQAIDLAQTLLKR
jgi:uncharacterized protein (TIGR00725 family)